MTTVTAEVASFAAKSAAVLTDDGADQGIIEALVSVFGNVDLHGDRVMPGAFAGVVEAFNAGAKSIPVVWSHNTFDIDGFLGDVVGLEETDEGLKATMQFDLDDPKAAKAYRLLKGGRVREYSFAYDVLDSRQVDGVRELLKLNVSEVGPTMYGANPATRTLAAKSDAPAAKAGRRISKATAEQIAAARQRVESAAEELSAAAAELTDLLPDVGDETPPADVTGEASDEEPAKAKSTARSRLSPEEIRALTG